MLNWLHGLEKAGTMLQEVRLQAERCPAARSPFITCRCCVEVCPQQAIEMKARRLTLDLTRCNACGLCEAACPNGAFKISGPASEEWLLATCHSHALKYGSVTIVCSRSVYRHHDRDVIEVTCLGRLAWEIIAGLALSEPSVQYASGTCQTCSLHKGATQWLVNWQRAKLTLAALGLDRVTPASSGTGEKSFPAAAPPLAEGVVVGRRTLFTGAIKFLATTLTGGEVKPAPVAAVPKPTWRRQWLVRSLQDCLGRPPGCHHEHPYLPWPALSLTGPCFLCSACATLCPVGALKVENNILRHFPGFCTQCGLCQAVCPYKSLELSGQVTVENFLATAGVVLAQASRHTCSYCGEEFSASGQPDKCGRCSLQERLGVLPRQGNS